MAKQKMTPRRLLALMKREQDDLLDFAKKAAAVIADYRKRLAASDERVKAAREEMLDAIVHPDDDPRFEIPEGISDAKEHAILEKYNVASANFDEMVDELDEISFPDPEDVPTLVETEALVELGRKITAWESALDEAGF